jgi:hypothetical protein
MTICTICSSSGCGQTTGTSSSIARRDPCSRLARLLSGNSTGREIVRPSSFLGLLAHAVEKQHGLSWETVQTAAYTPLPEYPVLTARDMALLRRCYEDGADHNTLAKEFDLTPGSVRVYLTRIRNRLRPLLTPQPKG